MIIILSPSIRFLGRFSSYFFGSILYNITTYLRGFFFIFSIEIQEIFAETYLVLKKKKKKTNQNEKRWVAEQNSNRIQKLITVWAKLIKLKEIKFLKIGTHGGPYSTKV